MSSPIPTVIHLQTPLPVTIHGQVPVIVHGKVPITASTAIPVSVKDMPPPDWTAFGGLIASIVAALAAGGAVYFAWQTLKKVNDQIGLAKKQLALANKQLERAEDQLTLANAEIELVRQEVEIVGKSAVLVLSTLHSPDTVRCNPRFAEMTGYPVPIALFEFEFTAIISNSGNKAVPEVLLFFWLPGNVTPIWHGEQAANPWRHEFEKRDFAGQLLAPYSYRMDRRFYPHPYRTQEPVTFRFNDGRSAAKGFEGTPDPLDFYWQAVCDDGTFPTDPATLHVQFG